MPSWNTRFGLALRKCDGWDRLFGELVGQRHEISFERLEALVSGGLPQKRVQALCVVGRRTRSHQVAQLRLA